MIFPAHSNIEISLAQPEEFQKQAQWEALLAKKSFTKPLPGLRDLAKSKEGKAAIKSGLKQGKNIMKARKHGDVSYEGDHSQHPGTVVGDAAAGAVGGEVYEEYTSMEDEEYIQQDVDGDGNTVTDEGYPMQTVDEDGDVLTYAQETVYENGETVATYAEETHDNGMAYKYEAVSHEATSYDYNGNYDSYDAGGTALQTIKAGHWQLIHHLKHPCQRSWDPDPGVSLRARFPVAWRFLLNTNNHHGFVAPTRLHQPRRAQSAAPRLQEQQQPHSEPRGTHKRGRKRRIENVGMAAYQDNLAQSFGNMGLGPNSGQYPPPQQGYQGQQYSYPASSRPVRSPPRGQEEEEGVAWSSCRSRDCAGCFR
ncbi:hypothetical protein NLG97_g6184 [Lecanicillium saksenae]|uniref:Uncharacterized protein n=1 Tax=Lecanicillium saksenae TaxID=468837 RepID=A0ACC1QU63_9HYPO|nr:hypothetical protein NLG97_g6184 [Lecanicillium saksenae]